MADKVHLSVEDFMRVSKGMMDVSKINLGNFTANYRVARNLAFIRTASEAFDRMQGDLIKKFVVHKDGKAESDPKTNEFIFVKPEDKTKYIAARKEMFDKGLEMEILRIDVADLKKSNEITGEMLHCLMPIINEEEPKKG